MADTPDPDFLTYNSGRTLMNVYVLPSDYLDEASRYMIDTYGWDFTLNELYNPVEQSMSKWPIISAGVPITE